MIDITSLFSKDNRIQVYVIYYEAINASGLESILRRTESRLSLSERHPIVIVICSHEIVPDAPIGAGVDAGIKQGEELAKRYGYPHRHLQNGDVAALIIELISIWEFSTQNAALTAPSSSESETSTTL